MTQNIIITGNRHSQNNINIMEMDPYNSKTANLLHEYDTKIIPHILNLMKKHVKNILRGNMK